MKVSVRRGGGVAGISTRTELDERDLSPADARTFAEKVGHANLSHEPQHDTKPWPDQTLYELVLDDGEEVRVQFTDQSLPEGARTLIEWIESRPECTQQPDT